MKTAASRDIPRIFEKFRRVSLRGNPEITCFSSRDAATNGLWISIARVWYCLTIADCFWHFNVCVMCILGENSRFPFSAFLITGTTSQENPKNQMINTRQHSEFLKSWLGMSQLAEVFRVLPNSVWSRRTSIKRRDTLQCTVLIVLLNKKVAIWTIGSVPPSSWIHRKSSLTRGLVVESCTCST